MTTKLNRVKSVMQAGLYALLFFVACGQAVAHQQKIAITTVLFNPRTKNIEIMHRFNLHDAEHAVKAMFKKTADILDDKDTQARFASYVANRFVLFDAQNDSLPLNLVGFEVEGKHFWVYQETAQPPALGSPGRSAGLSGLARAPPARRAGGGKDPWRATRLSRRAVRRRTRVAAHSTRQRALSEL